MGCYWQVSHRVSGIAIALIYIYVTAVTSLPFVVAETLKDMSAMKECDLYYIYQPTYTMLTIIFHVVLSLTVTFVLYGRIFRVALRQKRAVAALRLDDDQKEAKLTWMMVLILGVHFLSAVPYLIVVALRYEAGDAVTAEREFELSQTKKVLHFPSSNQKLYNSDNRWRSDGLSSDRWSWSCFVSNQFQQIII